MGEALTHARARARATTPVTGVDLHQRGAQGQGGPAVDVVLRLLFSRRRTGVRTDATTMGGRRAGGGALASFHFGLLLRGARLADGGTPAFEPIVVDSSRRRVVRYLTAAATCCTLSRCVAG